jgi:aminoglycoside phosphotransferase (APT) family kinase protein
MAVDAVDLVGPHGAARRLVMRRWLRPGWEAEGPEFTAAHEAAVLDRLAPTDVPAPRLVAVDPDGTRAGVPALLMTHVDGRRVSARDEARPGVIGEMAAVLARIHRLDGGVMAVAAPFRPYYEHDEFRIPTATRQPSLWQRALERTERGPAAATTCFLHRDFHPGNTIWQRGHLAGVVDWTSASWGPAATDLAHWRANIGTRHGIETADRILTAYAAETGDVPRDQAWWDVRMLLDFIDEPGALNGEPLTALEAYLADLLTRT